MSTSKGTNKGTDASTSTDSDTNASTGTDSDTSASINTSNQKLLIDIGSTYFKVSTTESIEQHFRDFNKQILDDLLHKCGDTVQRFEAQDIHICSSANGGLSALIIGLTHSYSLKYATNIAFNAGINIIDSIVFQNIEDYSIPSDLIDVVIIVGGIDSNGGVFDERLNNYLAKLNYSNVVYVGNKPDTAAVASQVERLVVLFRNFIKHCY